MPSARPRKACLLRNSRRTLTHAALAAAVSVALTGTGAAAQDTAPKVDWTQFQAGPAHPGSTGGGPAPPYREAWAYPAPGGGISFPIIVGDTVVAVGRRGVYGVDLETGARVWTLLRNGGPLAAPAVGEVGQEQILAFTDEAPGGDTRLVGVDLGTMRELWRTPLEAVSRSGVTVDGGTAFVGDDDGNVYGVDLGTGKVLWTAKAIGLVQGPPAAAGGVVYVVSRAATNQQVQVLALRATDGGEVWAFQPRVAAGSTGSVASVGDGHVFVGFGDRIVRALRVEDGEVRWGSLVGALVSPVVSPASVDGDVFVADVSGGLYRLDGETGDHVWSYQFNDLVVRSSPAVSAATVLLGLNDGRLVAVDTGSGDLVWQSAPTPGLIGSIAVGSDRVVAVKGGSHQGLVAFEHDAAGRLVRIPSPTELDLGEVLRKFGLAFVIVFVVLLVPSTIAARRMGALGLPEPSVPDEDGEG